MPFRKVAIIGLGLLGSSVGLAVREHLSDIKTCGYDADADVRAKARELGLCDDIAESAETAAHDADLVILCVPVGAMRKAAEAIAPGLSENAIISDVGSSKERVSRALAETLPDHTIIPAHPVAGTEQSGPEAGFASLFHGRWCIITPPVGADEARVEKLADFWRGLGSTVEIMDAGHHDMVLAVTSHIPHLIAYTIVGTASDLEDVTRSEVIKYSAGGFRDFTRIAASDPTMWRDVFLHNKDAVLEMMDRFLGDLGAMRDAIESEDGEAMFDLFSRTRAIRRGILEQGQDDARPDFGREHT
ncbi:prephenate/arogenate dehydrogenase family protein [Aurantiacibacter sp. D1-12]|uniref:prephenate/arogenate dehydrogenase family protein n=1 Tax=Aurantiacibacter sp. D1-12 TaxID=2993658 RepID=UPI00237C680C|nr:prephenate/arogenate dehydrogenase family protein [Aurantiacibacter sp. D1-12]MDE1467489.1 prephenate/arogenate dehydrogenase family protein [Aurantiacibacter sp. D1-12]